MPFKDTILLIEDDHEIRVSFRQILEGCGYFIYSAANGRDGLAILEKISPPKLIILDLGMPIMDGEEFLKLKEANLKLKDIPVLIVTCNQNKIEIMNKHPYLIKPVDLDVFTNKVTSCMSLHSFNQ